MQTMTPESGEKRAEIERRSGEAENAERDKT
jgi:hypothetical protein